MAATFKITLQQKTDNLHLRLTGDFDGSSACELLNILEERCPFVSRACIDTDGLKHIYPFGSSFFRNHLDDLKPCRHKFLKFTGAHARELKPDHATLH